MCYKYQFGKISDQGLKAPCGIALKNVDILLTYRSKSEALKSSALLRAEQTQGLHVESVDGVYQDALVSQLKNAFRRKNLAPPRRWHRCAAITCTSPSPACRTTPSTRGSPGWLLVASWVTNDRSLKAASSGRFTRMRLYWGMWCMCRRREMVGRGVPRVSPVVKVQTLMVRERERETCRRRNPRVEARGSIASHLSLALS